MTEPAYEQLLERMLAVDRRGANDLTDAWAEEHGYDRAVEELLEPALRRLGGLWDEEAVSLAQGYLSAKIAGDVMAKVAASRPTVKVYTRGPVVLGNIEDDFHALGRRLVVTFLQAAGWKVHDLGNDVLPETFVDKAVEVGAKVVGASAMMLTTARNIRRLRDEIDRRQETGRIQLAVGGAVFCLRPELVGEVGGDGTARNALGAAALFERLWRAAEAAEVSGVDATPGHGAES